MILWLAVLYCDVWDVYSPLQQAIGVIFKILPRFSFRIIYLPGLFLNLTSAVGCGAAAAIC